MASSSIYVATLVASSAKGQGALTAPLIEAAAMRLAEAGCGPDAPEWLEEGTAADIGFAGEPAAARRALEGAIEDVDIIVQPRLGREKSVLIADMDSTMITVECIDELADYAGFKTQVAEVTERAMRGELDFAAALSARVSLLKGMDEAVIDRCREERVRIMPGAAALVRTMRARGAMTVLVSGGFTRFAEPVAAEIGFERVVANILEIERGELAGTVRRPIVDSARKQAELLRALAERGLEPGAAMAIGDGANDIPMIEAAGLGVAYHAKPKTREAAAARIDHGDLSALLWAQGIKRPDWEVL